MTLTSNSAQPDASDESWVRSKIIGTWKLVSAEQTLRNGSTRPMYGPNGQGYLTYSPDGFMSVVLMNPDRPPWANPSQPTPADKASAFDGSAGYSGRYEIDARRHALVHLPEVSTAPDFVATRQVRPYRFEASPPILRMILSDIVSAPEGDVASWKLVWEKVR